MSEMHNADEQDLIDSLRARDRGAFESAVNQFSGTMLATASAIAGASNAEDIVQDAWVAVLKRIDTFEQRASLKTWLIRIVTNRAISYLRSNRKTVSLTADAESGPGQDWFDNKGKWVTPPPAWDLQTPEAMLSATDLQNCIDKHLALMPDAQRQVIILRNLQEVSFDEICNELELSASNVRVLLHRGRTRLMKMTDKFQATGSC